MHDARTEVDVSVVPFPADFRPLRLCQVPGGYVLDLTRPSLVCGRHSEADLRLPLADVSRRHCRFEFAAGGWQMTDLGSLNGVYVNGQRLTQANLAEGDVLRIGGLNFRVELPADESLRLAS